jgi:hypothetical protein
VARGKLEEVLLVQATSRQIPGSQPFKRLTTTEMTDRREKGSCFNCDEKFTPGYRCSRSFCIEVIYDDEVDDHLLATLEDDPHVSLHALTGIESAPEAQCNSKFGWVIPT